MKNNCVFCQNKFDEFSIKEYANWDLQLYRDDQYYIGRTVLVFTDRHIEDVTELTKTERDEAFDIIIPQLQQALETLFEPEMYNYTSIGNDCPHLHFHIIPRYAESVSFNGRVFTDEFWGETYAQDYDNVTLTIEELHELIRRLRAHIP